MSPLRGTGVSPGIAVGRALVVERDTAPVFRLALEPAQVEGEVGRLEAALEQSRAQLRAIKERLSREVGAPHAYIFDAHLLMLDDPLLRDRAAALVRDEQVNAEWALRTVSESLHELFSQFSDAYLRERSTDLDDVIGRVQLNLRGSAEAPSLERLPGPVVLVAGDLTPSEAAELDWERVLAVDHRRGLVDVPHGDHRPLARYPGRRRAEGGHAPDPARQPRGGRRHARRGRGRPLGPRARTRCARPRRTSGARRSGCAARGRSRRRTLDGVPVRLEANVEFPEEAATAQPHGAEGIGLFRSEYLLGRGLRWPSEEQQIDVYRRLLEQMHPHPVTVRTWDVGLEALGPAGPSSPNPALGERALRLLRRSREPFRTQLRALLRAGRHGPIRIMFPFVSGPTRPAAGPRAPRRGAGAAARRGPRLPGRRPGRREPRGAERGADRRPPRARRSTSSASARTT